MARIGGAPLPTITDDRALGSADIQRSLRFSRLDSAYLSRALGSPTSDDKASVSVWLKRTDISTDNTFFDNYQGTNDRLSISLLSSTDGDALSVYQRDSSGIVCLLTTTQVFRDPDSWYHLLIAFDTTQSTAADRVKIYVNGTQVTSFSSSTYFSQNHNLRAGSGYTTNIGRYGAGSNYFGGYMAEFNYIDGQQLSPTDVGFTDSQTGIWMPKRYEGSYGNNGFRLDFSDNSSTAALGIDKSPNGNDFTTNNFSVSAGAGNDSVEDTPTNNFPTFNPLCENNNHTYSEGNLKVTYAANNQSGNVTTMSSPKTGKWYWEVRALDNYLFIGVTANTYLGTGNIITATNTGGSTVAYYSSGDKYVGGSSSTYNNQSYTNGDLIGVALDMDNGQVTFYKNNTSQGAISLVSTEGHLGIGAVGTGQSLSMSINFGQQAFSYTPPTGFKKLNSANLPDPTILLPNQHFDSLLYTGNGATSPRAITGLDFAPDWVWLKNRATTYHHQLHDTVRGTSGGVLYSNNTEDEDPTYSLSSFDSNGFSIAKDANQDGQNNNGNGYVAWNWNAGDTDGKTYTVKVVSDSGNKYRFDDFGTSAVTLDLAEGGTYVFDWSDSSAQSHPIRFSTTSDGTHGGGSEYTTGVTKDDSAYKTTITVAASAPTLYYYCQNHSGMGGQVNTNSTLGSSNFDGTLQATVKANPTAGFSVVTYTGNGSSGATIGHGLGVAPKAAFVKRRDGSSNWISPFFDLQTAGKLNGSDSFTNSYYNTFFTSQPTSSLITIGSNDDINRNTSTYVAYVFSEVAGYSKFGSYSSNGNSNGTFVLPPTKAPSVPNTVAAGGTML